MVRVEPIDCPACGEAIYRVLWNYPSGRKEIERLVNRKVAQGLMLAEIQAEPTAPVRAIYVLHKETCSSREVVSSTEVGDDAEESNDVEEARDIYDPGRGGRIHE